MFTAEDRDGWVDFYQGAREVYAQLGARIDGDPLPWEPWPDGRDEVPGGVRSHRQSKRTTLTLQRAFLSGALVGFFGTKPKNLQIPSIAFADFKIAHTAFTLGGLELDPLWPDEWQSYNGDGFFVRTEQFRSWLSGSDWLDGGELPDMPCPHDSAPTRIATREPSQLSYVPLSEALSFMAFGLALGSERLTRALDWSLLMDGDSSRALSQLTEAVAVFCDTASAEPQVIRTRGKHVDGYAGEQAKGALLSNIEPVAFANYARFDAMHDGLAFGTGTSYQLTPVSYLFDQSRHDGYRNVVVHREDLMAAFPAGEVIEKPAIATTSTARAENECREWLSGEFAADPGKQRTKTEFKSAALARFSGRLSERGFIRAWDAVAPHAGRSKPGRKS